MPVAAGAPPRPICGRSAARAEPVRAHRLPRHRGSCSRAGGRWASSMPRRRCSSGPWRRARSSSSGGAINSPQLLLLSGIGAGRPSGRASASTVAHDLPGVGANLQDHLEFYFQVECTRARHPLARMRPPTWSGSACAGSCSTRPRRASRISRRVASSARGPGVRHPDIQFHFLPALVEDHGRSKGRITPTRPCRADAADQPGLAAAALDRPAPSIR